MAAQDEQVEALCVLVVVTDGRRESSEREQPLGGVLERIARLKSMGITQLALIVDFGSLAQADIMRSLEVFARDILPQAKDI